MNKPKPYLKAAIISIIFALFLTFISTMIIHRDRSFASLNMTSLNSKVISRGWPFVNYEEYSYSGDIDSMDNLTTSRIIWGGVLINFSAAFILSFVASLFLLDKKIFKDANK